MTDSDQPRPGHGAQVVFAADRSGRCTMASGDGELGPGTSAADLLGRDLREVFAEPDQRAALDRALAGETVSLVTDAASRRLRTTFTPRLVDGGVEGTVGVTSDVTDQAAAEAVRFRALVETSGDFIAIAALDGTVLYVNPAGRAMVDLPPDVDVTTTVIHDYLTPDGIKRSELVEQPAVVAHGRWQGQSTLRGPGGTAIPVEISSFLMRDPHTDEPLALATVQRDITERLAAERAQDEFTAMVAHELRTPLASVKGYVELAADAVEAGADPETVSAHLRVADRNVSRMERLVEQILKLASERRPRADVRPRQDLVELVSQAVESVRPAVEGSGLELQLTTDHAVGVHVDEGFSEVVDNLLSNAAKYTPAGGRVQVHLELDGGEAVLRVADDGPGVPEDERDLIFDRFVRGPSHSHQSVPGLGLGLFISRSIVLAHQGSITVGDAPGGGALFEVRLPSAEQGGTP